MWLGAFTPAEQEGLLLDGVGGDPFAEPRRAFAAAPTRDPVDRLVYAYAKTYLQDDILVKVDRASMACSLEVRAPFLDVELVEFLGRVPSRLKLRRFQTKHLLKRAMADVLPPGIAGRPKKGFGIPVAEWLKGELREPVLDELSPDRLRGARGSSRRTKWPPARRAPGRAARPPQAALDAVLLPALAPPLRRAALACHDRSPRVDGVEMAPGTRLRVAQILAFVGLVAALVGALGPAETVRTTYSWPPEALPQGEPTSFWYTPLLLARHRPESLTAALPCAGAAPLAEAGTCRRVLATARFPERTGGLAVRQSGEGLEFTLGEDVFAIALRGRLSAHTPPRRRRLVARRRSRTDRRAGGARATPVVTGFFSGFDLRTSPRPTAELDTGVHAVNARPHQTLAWIVAALAIGAALSPGRVRPPARPPAGRLVARPRERTSRGRRRRRRAARLVGRCHRRSGTTAGSPLANGRSSTTAGSRTTTTRSPATSRSAYWLEWSQHWLTQSVDSLLWLRVPSLLLLAATWVLCRWILARIAAPSRVALWALTAAFLVGAMAGGMTLRPEPVTAFFLVAVLACVVRFREHESAAPLALATALVPFAILGHPAGIVTFAPLLVVAPPIVRFARANIAVAGTLIASGSGSSRCSRSSARTSTSAASTRNGRGRTARMRSGATSSCATPGSRTTRTGRRCAGWRWRSSGSRCSPSSCAGGATGSRSSTCRLPRWG